MSFSDQKQYDEKVDEIKALQEENVKIIKKLFNLEQRLNYIDSKKDKEENNESEDDKEESEDNESEDDEEESDSEKENNDKKIYTLTTLNLNGVYLSDSSSYVSLVSENRDFIFERLKELGLEKFKSKCKSFNVKQYKNNNKKIKRFLKNINWNKNFEFKVLLTEHESDEIEDDDYQSETLGFEFIYPSSINIYINNADNVNYYESCEYNLQENKIVNKLKTVKEKKKETVKEKKKETVKEKKKETVKEKKKETVKEKKETVKEKKKETVKEKKKETEVIIFSKQDFIDELKFLYDNGYFIVYNDDRSNHYLRFNKMKEGEIKISYTDFTDKKNNKGKYKSIGLKNVIGILSDKQAKTQLNKLRLKLKIIYNLPSEDFDVYTEDDKFVLEIIE